MPLSKQFKGYIFSFIAVLAMSNVFIFSKAALNEVELIQFGFYWFGFAILWNLLYALPAKKYKNISRLKRNTYLALIFIGVFELVGTTFFFIAINKVENPAIVSFLGNMTPVFVTTFGVFLLKERFNIIEAFGFVLTISGAFIISYNKGSSMSDIFMEGTGYVILSSFLFSFAFIVAKKTIKNVDPGILSMNRVLYLFVFSVILMIIYRFSLVISWKGLYNILLGSLLGPFLASIANYSAIKYIEVSRASIIGSSKSLLVLIGAYIYFGTFPQILQVVGGLATIIGVVLVITGKSIFKDKV
jgi:drug/metabolite transporter (DMT)-like permease